MKYTIVDAYGSIVKRLELSNDTHLEPNLHDGEYPVAGWSESFDFRHVDGEWVPLPARPGPYHNWDRATLQWVDIRILVNLKAQKLAELARERNSRAYEQMPPNVISPTLHVNGVFSVFAQLKARVDSATTNSQVDEVLWP